MAITWANARTKLRGDLWRSGTSGLPDDVCDRALHASILELESERRWSWLENISTSDALQQAADRIALPADFSSAQSLTVTRSAGEAQDGPLSLLSIGRLRVLASASAGGGWPSAYAISGSEAHLDCAAPAGATFELIYTARTPDDLTVAVAAGDANATLDLQETAVIANAAHFAAINYLRNEAEGARKRAVYERILGRLNNREDELRGDLYGGCAVPDVTYDLMARGIG